MKSTSWPMWRPDSPAGLLIAALAFPLLAQTQAAAAQETQEEKEIDLIWGVKIPLRDGVQLNAPVYKPKEMAEPLPVIFALTPYIATPTTTAPTTSPTTATSLSWWTLAGGALRRRV